MRRSWLKRARTERVILHLTDDMSAQGVLVGVYADGVALRHAELLSPGSQPTSVTTTSIAGELFFPRERVAFVQLEA